MSTQKESTRTDRSRLSGAGTLDSHDPAYPQILRRPPKPAKIRRQKQEYHNGFTSMGFHMDEPFHHTRYSAALRYADKKEGMAEQRGGLVELPFAVTALSPPPSAALVKNANKNDVIGLGSSDAEVEVNENSMSKIISCIQTPDKSRKMRRTRSPERRDRERFEKLIGGKLPEDIALLAPTRPRFW